MLLSAKTGSISQIKRRRTEMKWTKIARQKCMTRQKCKITRGHLTKIALFGDPRSNLRKRRLRTLLKRSRRRSLADLWTLCD